MYHHFLINPAAGRGSASEYVAHIQEYFQSDRAAYTIFISRGPGDIARYVKEIASQNHAPRRFYACGGDGTLFELINSAAAFPHVSVGIIPTGTGNDWIRNFDHPSAFRQIGAQVEATATPIDLIRANQHYALNMLNIGFDCNVVYAASQLKKRPFLQGPLAYIAGIMQELCHPMGTRLHIALENEEPLSGEFLLCTIANGSFCGGGFQSSPRAQINDELLDIAVIQKISRLRFLSLLPSYRSGRYLSQQEGAGLLFYRQCRQLTISADTPFNVSLDGEIFSYTSLHIQLLPQALSFLIPKGSAIRNLSHE